MGFIQKISEAKLGLSFDDVLLVPSYSEILPKDVNLTTRITKKVKLDIPIVSYPMDTITESKMALALAEEGIIHRNLSIEEQTREVRIVKEKGLKVGAAGEV